MIELSTGHHPRSPTAITPTQLERDGQSRFKKNHNLKLELIRV